MSKPFRRADTRIAAGRPRTTDSDPADRRGWRAWVVVGSCLLLMGTAAAASWAIAEFVVFNRLPSNLVGKWVVDGGEQDGATFDFFRNGTMEGRINVNGNEHRIDAWVRVEGDKLLSTTRNPNTGQDETRPQEIKVLTQTHLVLQDSHGQQLHLSRAE
jgi:uncharacterized protein (TIGR03066 family)